MPNNSNDFVHLHQHTDNSLLDGCCRIDKLMDRVSELGMSAISITDHGNLFGIPKFCKEAEKRDIKPIIGCELYFVHDHKMTERPKRERKRSDDINDIPEEELGPEQFPKNQIHHKGILAKNFQGYQNLSKLVSDAHINGLYYRHRTDIEHLAEFSDGLIGLSGCMNGVASQYIAYNDYANARKATAQFVDVFGKENYFIELQDHGMNVQRRIIPGLIKLAKEFDLKVVCTNDVHYVNKSDWEPHDAMLCIQTGKRISDEDRMRYPSQEFYLKSRQEMDAIFKEIPEAVTNTLHVAEMCEVKLPYGENHYPQFEKPIEITYNDDQKNFNRVLDIYVEEKNKVLTREEKPEISLSEKERNEFFKNGSFLFALCKKGLKERYGVDYDNPDAYEPQGDETEDFAKDICAKLEYELAIITGTGFVDYFLIVWDFIDWARKDGIPVGPGRGSGAGCIVAYVLKITDIDPLRFGLLFERMLNLERVSPPDFDIDFCMRRRDDVVNYVRDKYGKDSVANIITYGTFGAKMVMRDVARVLDIPYADADRIAKMIPDDLNISIAESIKKSKELKDEISSNPLAKKIITLGTEIEGMIRNTGKHACGIIIGDQPLTNLVPITVQEDALTTQYAKGPVEDLGLLKMDFLGLKTLTVLFDAQEHVKRTRNLPDFNIEEAPLDDEKTYDLLNSGQTTGVFQLESGGMQNLCRRIGLSKFEEIIALIALYRPGPMDFIPQFIEGKKDPSTVKVPHPLLEKLAGETYGVLVYQEQVMQSAQIIAGYTLGDADILRRAMGKKIPEVMAAQQDRFVEGAKSHRDINRKTALEIFAILEKFAKYGFNKSHSAAYAMLSYRTAYLKANYPVEFMSAVLSNELKNADKVSQFIDECSEIGISVLGPDVNESFCQFAPVKDGGSSFESIRFGLAAIRGVGDIAANNIIEEREANGAFADFADFATRTDGRTVNKRVIECLIYSGAFDYLKLNRQHLLNSVEGTLSAVAGLKADKESGQTNLFGMLEDDSSGGNGATNTIDTSGPILPELEKLQKEKELLGFYVSGHPMNKFNGIDQAINSFDEGDLDSLEDQQNIRLCGVLNNVQKRITKKDNKQWALFNVATLKSTYQFTLFPDSYVNYGDILEDGQIVLVHGQIRKKDGETQFNAHQIGLLGERIFSLIKSINWLISPDEKTDDFLKQLNKYILENEGKTEVQLTLQLNDAQGIKAALPQSLHCSFNQENFEQLQNHSAVRGIQIETFDIPAPKSRWGNKKK